MNTNTHCYWHRRVCFLVEDDTSCTLNLDNFDRVRVLMVSRNKSLHEPTMCPLFSFETQLRSIHELELFYDYRPTPYLMLQIENLFPELRILRVSGNMAWCGLCHLCYPVFLGKPPQSNLMRNSPLLSTLLILKYTSPTQPSRPPSSPPPTRCQSQRHPR